MTAYSSKTYTPTVYERIVTKRDPVLLREYTVKEYLMVGDPGLLGQSLSWLKEEERLHDSCVSTSPPPDCL